MSHAVAPLRRSLRSPRRALACALALLAVALCACTRETRSDALLRADALPVRHGTGRLPFEETVLENGLRVISLEDRSAPIVAVQLWYHVGSKDEQPDRQGFAHMFEHMMFRGTDRLGPKDHFDLIRRTGGDCNAYTSFDQTVYVQELPSNQLPLVLWLEAERMAHLKIDEGGFATERRVVEEERRLGLNQPYGDVLEQILAAMFSEHPYRWSPIGQIEHLRAATVDDIQHFWDTFYVPNNATLVVVGDVSGAEVRRLAQQCFGWIPRCPDPPRVTVQEPEQQELRRIRIEPKNGPVPIAAIAFRAVPQGHPDAVALELLMSILGGGESSRVYVDLVRRKDIAIAGLATYAGIEQAGFAAVAGVLTPLGNTERVLEALWEQVERLRAEGPTDEELEKARKLARVADVTGSLTIASKAGALGEAAVLFGDAQEANARIARLSAVTPAELRRVAETYLVAERASEIVIKPGAVAMLRTALGALGAAEDSAAPPPEAETEAAGQRALAGGPKAAARAPLGYPEQPPVAPPLAVGVDLPHARFELDNGLRVVVVSNHEVPFLSLSLRLPSGAWTEPATAPGTASLAAAMITRGTIARDAEALAAELERHGISLSASAGADDAGVDVSCLVDDAERAVRILAEVVAVPRFDAREFRTLQSQTVTGLTVSEKAPAAIAGQHFDAALWGGHPYARPSSGTAASVGALAVDGLREWWERHARPDQAVLYMAGDITPDAARALLEGTLGRWDADPLPAPAAPTAAEPTGSLRILLVDQPGAIQSEIVAGHEGITRRHRAWPAAAVLSQVFGGAFTSRLNDVLRVQRGLTYGASGGLTAGRFGGSLRVRTFTRTETTAETVRAVIEEVARLRDEPPTEDELSAARSYLAGSFAGSLETPQAVANRLWLLERDGLAADWWSEYLAAVSSVSADAVEAAADALLDSGRLLIVVVGDAAAIAEELEQIAPVERVNSEG